MDNKDLELLKEEVRKLGELKPAKKMKEETIKKINEALKKIKDNK